MISNMIDPGLLPVLQKSHLNDYNLLELVESLLDSGVRQFVWRSAGFREEEYRDSLADIELLQEHLDFQYLAHHFDSCFDSTTALGLHLTSRSHALQEIRAEWGPQPLLGYSAHSFDEALKAEDDGANYIFLGAIFETPKNDANHPILGPEILQKVCRRLTIPVVAIGGINDSNLKQIKDAGAYGFSAMRALFENETLEHNIAKLQWLWDA